MESAPRLDEQVGSAPSTLLADLLVTRFSGTFVGELPDDARDALLGRAQAIGVAARATESAGYEWAIGPDRSGLYGRWCRSAPTGPAPED
jgi:hypothetical protein